MKDRNTAIVLLVGIIFLGAFVWIQESWRTKNAPKIRKEVLFFDLHPATLEWIEFKHTNGVVRCAKENGVWMIGDEQGNSGRADVGLVYHMLSGLNSMGKGTTITARHRELRGFDTAEYGFDDPFVEISAMDNTGEHEWFIGRATPLGGMVYAKTGESEDIYTLVDKVMMVVPYSYDLLRDRVLFPGDPAGIRRLEIRGPAGLVELVKDIESGWAIQQPVAAQADPREVEGFIAGLYYFRIEEFVADNVSDFSVYGLQGESRQISVGGADETSRMLIVGDDVPDRPGFVYARRADDMSVFTLSADILQLLDVDSIRFRNAAVVSVVPEAISSVGVQHGDKQLSLEMDESGRWGVKAPVVWEAETKAVTDLITLWSSAVITDYDIGTNSVAADWVFEFGSAAAGITNRIEVLPTRGRKDGLLIRKDGSKVAYQINLPAVPAGVVDPLVYKNKHILRIGKEDVDRIAVLRGDGLGQVIERHADRTFIPADTNINVQVNMGNCSKLLGQLEEVRTTGYITSSPHDLDLYGLASPSLELQVSLSNSNELGRVLLIGRETPDGFYSMLKGRDVVFYLDKSLVEILSADLFELNGSGVLSPSE